MASAGVNLSYGGSRSPQGSLTSEVLDEVLQLHLALSLHAGAVHVCVKQDHSESQDEDGVRVLELAHQRSIADTVALAGG